MNVVHLTASTFFGGPERQMLGLARSLAGHCRTIIVSFAEGGRCSAFLEEARRHGFEAVVLEHDTPHLRAALRDLTRLLGRVQADVLCCHGYKAGLLGRLAARRRQIPVIAVSRGWTGESLKVRCYEALDRLNLRWMDQVVCVSEGQARKVRRAAVPAERVTIIHNAVRTDRFDCPDPAYRGLLHGLFHRPPKRVVGAAGRLSPEKGFDVLIDAAARVVREQPAVGFVLFGAGPLREALAQRIADTGLTAQFVLAGFRKDLDRFLPFLDLLVLPSFTEGLPNVVLEAFAASVPVVATAVGGTPEVVHDGVSGFLVPPGNATALAGRIQDGLADETQRQQMGRLGRQRVEEHFTFAAQALGYRRLFAELRTAGTREPAVATETSPLGSFSGIG